MLKEFVEKLLDLKRPEMIQVGERNFTIAGYTPATPPSPAPVVLSTLTGLTDYVRENRDKLPMESLMVHVASHEEVNLISVLDGVWQTRKIYAQANRSNHSQGFRFDQYHDSETFLTQLQSKFAPTVDRESVQKIAGTMKDENVTTADDDGVTQSVATRTGVVLAQLSKVPNPVVLKPYRTFLEIEQPESNFVFRIKQVRSGELPHCGLFEADGGKWKLEAIARIKQFMAAGLPGVAILA